jgi:uncharacterized protein (DUF2252 family)
MSESARQYERWLAARMPLIKKDLDLKHRLMAQSVFSFMRATFFRWAQRWPEECPELIAAPRVLGIGDLQWRESR